MKASKILQTNNNQINTDLFLYTTVVVVNIVGEVIAANVVLVDDIVVGWGCIKEFYSESQLMLNCRWVVSCHWLGVYNRPANSGET